MYFLPRPCVNLKLFRSSAPHNTLKTGNVYYCSRIWLTSSGFLMNSVSARRHEEAPSKTEGFQKIANRTDP